MGENSSLVTNKEFSAIYDRNIDMVYRIAYMHLKNKADAEDAAQTVFMKYLNKRPDFKEREHEKAWFITTTKNYCRDILKHWWMSRRTEEETTDQGEYVCFDNEQNSDVVEAMLKLPSKYKDVLYLYYYEEYTVKEMSEILRRNESTIRTQLCKAREKMRKQLKTEVDYNEEITLRSGF